MGDIYKLKASEYEEKRHFTKQQYYTNAVMDCNGDQGSMFSIINSLLHRSSTSPLPTPESGTDLATEFSQFFENKIIKIHDQLSSGLCVDCISDSVSQPTCSFDAFTPVTPTSVTRIIKKSAIKSCPLNLIPAQLFTKSLDSLISFIVKAVNSSLTSGIMPDQLKKAMVIPILKKTQLDIQVLNNYRPVSNLPFLSKVIERVVAAQLNEYLMGNSLVDPLQSAYHQYHSTETALMHVLGDILLALDQKKSVFLVLLDSF